MKAIVTVVGKDTVGIIAAVCVQLASYNVNVLDIRQTVMQGFFTMMMAVDIEMYTGNFKSLIDGLNTIGQEIGCSIKAQHEEIFDMMHRI